MNFIHTLTSHFSSSQRSQRHDGIRAGEESKVRQQLALQTSMLKEQQRRIEELEAANAELRLFTAVATHDLKSPLTTIYGFAHLAARALDKARPESARSCLRNVQRAADRMGTLVADLQELAGLGRRIGEPAAVPLAEVVAEALDQLAGAIASRGVEIEVAMDLPVVVGDRGTLVRVVQNLVENGTRYMGEQPSPKIEIGAQEDGDDVVCSVRDNGAGIAPEHLERIFQPFERIGAQDGSGLGLFIVRRIVEAHGGRIWVESEGEGHGAAFCFTLRVAG